MENKISVKEENAKKRIENWLSICDLAIECSKAIVFHANLIANEHRKTFDVMAISLNKWNEQICDVKDTIVRVSMKCMQNTPVTPIGYMPNVAEVSNLLAKVGYTNSPADAFDLNILTKEQIMNNLEHLDFYKTVCIKALEATDFTGEWKCIHDKLLAIYESGSCTSTWNFLKACGMNMENENK